MDNPEKLKFKLFKKGVISLVMKLFGMQDIKIGSEEFDREFIIQSNSKSMITEVLTENIQKLLLSRGSIMIQLKEDEGWFRDKYPDGTDELYLEVDGVINSIDELSSIFDIFCLLADNID
jgi:hypothetical protein